VPSSEQKKEMFKNEIIIIKIIIIIIKEKCANTTWKCNEIR